MSEEQPKKITSLLSIFPVFIILVIDIFAMMLQDYAKALSHLSISVLIAQLICIVVFAKGEICNGQRSRLITVNLYFFIYWIIWLILSLFSNYHYIVSDVVSLCGIVTTVAIWQQPYDLKMRKSILVIGALSAVLGILTYIFMFFELPIYRFVEYNLVTQILVGIILANLALVISKNRLQGFISLLAVIELMTLLINALIVLIILSYSYINSIIFANTLAWIVYFVLHLLIAIILGIHIFYNIKLEYRALIILLFVSASLPVWSIFSMLA